ncbi:hypothetical protein NMY22_g5548 [Coprinellus aureogranulatus]|nr:hypothetical protein NMY22_g5548 [Coprinellus aureogranulatus]
MGGYRAEVIGRPVPGLYPLGAMIDWTTGPSRFRLDPPLASAGVASGTLQDSLKITVGSFSATLPSAAFTRLVDRAKDQLRYSFQSIAYLYRIAQQVLPNPFYCQRIPTTCEKFGRLVFHPASQECVARRGGFTINPLSHMHPSRLRLLHQLARQLGFDSTASPVKAVTLSMRIHPLATEELVSRPIYPSAMFLETRNHVSILVDLLCGYCELRDVDQAHWQGGCPSHSLARTSSAESAPCSSTPTHSPVTNTSTLYNSFIGYMERNSDDLTVLVLAWAGGMHHGSPTFPLEVVLYDAGLANPRARPLTQSAYDYDPKRPSQSMSAEGHPARPV